MTDTSPRGDRLLEVVVFAPAGLAVTVVEEFPKLVEKGRHRLEGQVHTARLVGQFAVQMGRRQLDQAVRALRRRRPAPATRRLAPAPTARSPASTCRRRSARRRSRLTGPRLATGAHRHEPVPRRRAVGAVANGTSAGVARHSRTTTACRRSRWSSASTVCRRRARRRARPRGRAPPAAAPSSTGSSSCSPAATTSPSGVGTGQAGSAWRAPVRRDVRTRTACGELCRASARRPRSAGPRGAAVRCAGRPG